MSSSHPWLKKFQIAIIENDANKIDLLIKDIPEFQNLEDMKSASTMIVEAGKILYLKKNEIAENLANIRKTKKFMQNGYGNNSYNETGTYFSKKN